VAAVFIAIIYIKAGGKWNFLARFGTTKVLLEYFASAAVIYSFLILLNVQSWKTPLPLLESLQAAGTKGEITGFSLIFVPLIFVLLLNIGFSDYKIFISSLWRAIRLPEIWIVAGVTAFTFTIIIGPFLLAAPQSTISQVFNSLFERPTGELPSYLGILFHTINNIPGILKFYSLTVIATVPVLYLLLRIRMTTIIHSIIAIGLVVSLISLQMVFHVPRYYIAIWPFLALGTACLFKDIRVI